MMRLLILLLILSMPSLATKPPCRGKRCHSVDLAWKSSPTPGIIAYGVYRNNVLVAKGAGLSMTDSTVLSGRTYTYYITAFDQYAESRPSNVITVAIP